MIGTAMLTRSVRTFEKVHAPEPAGPPWVVGSLTWRSTNMNAREATMSAADTSQIDHPSLEAFFVSILADDSLGIWVETKGCRRDNSRWGRPPPRRTATTCPTGSRTDALLPSQPCLCQG